jgi:hypothetical protein
MPRITVDPLVKQIVPLSKHWTDFLMLEAPPSTPKRSVCRMLGPHFSTAGILLLTSIAGAGETAIAHTVAQRCEDEDILFFVVILLRSRGFREK